MKTFFCEPIVPLTRRLSLRRYHTGLWNTVQQKYSGDGACPGKFTYHNAAVLLRDEVFEWVIDSDGDGRFPNDTLEMEKTLPREMWPTKCDYCAYQFDAVKDTFQVMQDVLYRRLDNGDVFDKRSIPPGALYYDEHDGRYFGGTGTLGPGPDGKYLIAVCPNRRHWCIDSRCSNCTMPNDNNHHCWVRHGDPRTGNVTVGKTGGKTCAAGGGSIQAGDYHGFLRGGQFTT